MIEEALAWIEAGFAHAVEALSGDYGPPDRQTPLFLSLLPPVAALSRLWGSLDPARAAGAAVALDHPLLRAAARAAAMEFASWPAALALPVLRRAAEDAVTPAYLAVTDRAVLLELWDEIAIAWARHDLAGLPSLHAALHGRWQVSGPSALWAQSIARKAEGRDLWPGPGLLSAGPRGQWAWEEAFGPTVSRRVRAALTLAVEELEAG